MSKWSKRFTAMLLLCASCLWAYAAEVRMKILDSSGNPTSMTIQLYSESNLYSVYRQGNSASTFIYSGSYNAACDIIGATPYQTVPPATWSPIANDSYRIRIGNRYAELDLFGGDIDIQYQNGNFTKIYGSPYLSPTYNWETAPSAPVISQTWENNHPKVYWSAVSGAAGYKIYRDGGQIATTSSLYYVDNTKVPYTPPNTKVTVYYKVKAYNPGGNSGFSNEVYFFVSGGIEKAIQSTTSGNASVPDRLALRQNYPNPFNSTTTFSFDLPNSTHVRLEVYDMTGRKLGTVIDGSMEAGSHSISWTADGLTSGIYLYRLQAESRVLTGKLILQK
jgi:hypothetical protein